MRGALARVLDDLYAGRGGVMSEHTVHERPPADGEPQPEMSADTKLAQSKLMNFKISHDVVVDLADQVIEGRAELDDIDDRMRNFFRTLLGVDDFKDMSHIDPETLDFAAIVRDEIASRPVRDQSEVLAVEGGDAAEAGDTE
jgi:hypothetical protein